MAIFGPVPARRHVLYNPFIMSFKNTKADCVIALSFGIRTNDSVNDPNRELARIAEDTTLPVIAQKEVGDYLKAPTLSVKNMNGYTDTWFVLQAAQDLMKKRHWRTAIIVAHSSHMPRALRQAKKIGIEPIRSESSSDVWDQSSSQWWTRGPKEWYMRELLTKPFLKVLNRI